MPPLFERLNAEVRTIEVLRCIARDTDMQRDAIARISEILDELESEKAAAVAAGNEDRANALLGYECAISALQHELQMYLLLKGGEPEKAWDELISAQDNSTWASRAHPGFAHMEQHLLRLEAVEELMFPPQVFMSVGLIVEHSVCSLCEADYEECDHIAGRPYWGRFCQRRLDEIRADHVSIVDVPADKRCRVTHFSDNGRRRNRMTWKLEAAPNDGADACKPDGALRPGAN